LFLSSAAVVAAALLAAAPVRWEALDDAGRAQALAALQPLAFEDRLLAASERFLGTPYGISPLGEGEGFDPDPRLRWDRVDCVTFVEESLALALSRTPEEVLSWLDAIRYRAGHVAYASRNHLMEADWLPANREAGFVRDVTDALGGPDAVQTGKVLTKASWQSLEARALSLPASVHASGRYTFGLLPAARVLHHAPAFPNGTLLLVVREDVPAHVTRISHLGLIVQREGHTYLRHATSVGPKAVVDEELGHFLERQAQLPWRLVGVSLWQLLPAESDQKLQ
jgi:hypothetical protein